MIVPMFAMTMVVLGELRLVTMGVTVVIDDDRNRELVRLWNFLDRFPIGPVVREHEVLPRIPLSAGLNRDGVGGYAGEPEAGRNPRLEDRQFENAVAGRNALQFRPMNRVRGSTMVMGMGEAMAVRMSVTALPVQIAPRCDRDPAAERDQRQAGGGIDDLTETFRRGDAAT